MRGRSLLGQGSFSEGWAEYTHRPWPAQMRAENPRLALTNRLPDDPRGKHICVLHEQGLGDELFFLRYAPQLHAAGARITYCASAKIASLLARVPCLAQVPTGMNPPTDSDAIIMAGDLPHALSAHPASALPLTNTGASEPARAFARTACRIAVFWPPAPAPLALTALAERLAEIRVHLAQCGPGPYIGLTWRGGTPPSEQRMVVWALYKEIGIAPLAAALKDAPGTYIALQRNPAPGELDALADALGRRVHDFTALNEDLEGMLALLTLLDDYVGVSNTNMHLRAGAGKTARVLVPSPPDWRWMMNHARNSPWFPGFSIYRQSLNGEWDAALAELKRDLISQNRPQSTKPEATADERR
jgi:hypothetical protein